MENKPSAKDIAQRLLDQTGQGLMTGDFELFATCFSLPHDIETFDGRRRLTKRADIKSVFDQVSAYFEKLGITDVVRHCVNADFRDPSTISTIHQSRIVRGTTLVQKPYHIFSVLKLDDGVWRICQSQYAIDDSPAHCRALVGHYSVK